MQGMIGVLTVMSRIKSLFVPDSTHLRGYFMDSLDVLIRVVNGLRDKMVYSSKRCRLIELLEILNIFFIRRYDLFLEKH